MTVSAGEPVVVTLAYTGAGSYAYGFTLYEDDEVLVTHVSTAGVRTAKTLTTHYTVSKNPSYLGGNIVTNFAGTGTLEIRLNLPMEQDYSWSAAGPLDLVILERMADKIVLRIRMLDYLIDNELSLPAYKSDWLTATEYDAGDIVIGDPGSLEGVYHCLIPHTSGTFADDIAAGKWEVLLSVNDIAAAVGLPVIAGGDQYKAVAVNATASNYELTHIVPPLVAGGAGKIIAENIAGNAYELVDPLEGPARRFKFEYVSATQIKLYGYAQYWVYDLGYVYCTETSITKTLSNISGTSYWHYLYLDRSEISARALSGTSVFIDSTTAPTYDATKKGWYNGSDRCIFAVRIDGSGNITKFWHEGGNLCIWDDRVVERALAAMSAGWNEVSFAVSAPPLADEVYMGAYMTDSTTNSLLYTRRSDSAAATGLLIAIVDATTSRWDHSNMIHPMGEGADENKIDFLSSGGTTTSLSVYGLGWILPDTL